MQKLVIGLVCFLSNLVWAMGIPTTNLPTITDFTTLDSKVSNSGLKLESQISNFSLPTSTALPPPEVQIGSNYFFDLEESKVANLLISQIGIAYEDRFNMSDAYIFFNQLLPNNLFYELRAYGAYNYITQNPALPASDVSNQTNPLGYGFVGILGYNIPFNDRVSLLPYVRFSYLYDFVAVYSDSNGNAINSKTYNGYLGARLSLKVTDLLALYANYFIGYQVSSLYGQGAFNNGSSPAINACVSTMEFGAPYRLDKSWSFIPYIDYNINANSPNAGAQAAPYNISQLTVNNTVFAVRFSYNF